MLLCRAPALRSVASMRNAAFRCIASSLPSKLNVSQQRNLSISNIFSPEKSVASPNFTNRWAMIAPAFLTHLCIGAPYAWSAMSGPLTRGSGFVCSAADDWTMTSATAPMSILFAFHGMSAALAGKWQMKVGTRATISAAALSFGGGFLLSAVGVATHNIGLVYLGYGVLGGIGLGLSYTPPIQVTLWIGLTAYTVIGSYLFRISVIKDNGRYRWVMAHQFLPGPLQYMASKMKLAYLSPDYPILSGWFQQDGARPRLLALSGVTAKFEDRAIAIGELKGLSARYWISSKLGDRTMAMGMGLKAFLPAHSPDCTLPDFYFWGNLNVKLSQNVLEREFPELKERVVHACRNIPREAYNRASYAVKKRLFCRLVVYRNGGRGRI